MKKQSFLYKLSIIAAVRLVMAFMFTIGITAIFASVKYLLFDSAYIDTFVRSFINIFMYACIFMTLDEIIFQIKHHIKKKTK